MLNQNRTIWPRRAKISIIISMTSRWRNDNVIWTYRVWIRQENISWFYISMSDSFWMKKFKSKSNWVNKRFHFTLRYYFWSSWFNAALQWSWIIYNNDSLLLMLIKSNHQKVQVGLSLKIFETFEFESLWNHLKIVEDFRDPSWRILKDHEDFEESCWFKMLHDASGLLCQELLPNVTPWHHVIGKPVITYRRE